MICSICNAKINNANKSKYSHLCKLCYNEFKKYNLLRDENEE